MNSPRPQHRSLVHRKAAALCAACLLLAFTAHSQQATSAPPTASAETRPLVIRSAADIPPRNYPLSIPPSEIVRTGEGFQALAAAVRKDHEQLLQADIRDNTVRLNLEYDLADLDLVDGNRHAMQERLTRIKSLEEKPAEKITSTLFMTAYGNAWATTPDTSPDFSSALEREYIKLLNASTLR